MPLSHYFPFMMHHFFSGVVHNDLQLAAYRKIGWSIVAINLLIVHRLARQDRQDAPLWAAILLFCCIPFLVESCWPHYLNYLPFCQAFLVYNLRGRVVTPALVAKVALLLVPSMVLSSVFMLNWLGGFANMARYGPLLIADILVMIFTWLEVPSLRLPAASPANDDVATGPADLHGAR